MHNSDKIGFLWVSEGRWTAGRGGRSELLKHSWAGYLEIMQLWCFGIFTMQTEQLRSTIFQIEFISFYTLPYFQRLQVNGAKPGWDMKEESCINQPSPVWGTGKASFMGEKWKPKHVVTQFWIPKLWTQWWPVNSLGLARRMPGSPALSWLVICS